MNFSKSVWHVTFFLALCLACCLPAHAHKASDSYLSLNVQDKTISGQWDIALRDLDFAIGLDGDGNGELTWDEIRARHPQIAAYALARLHLATAETGTAGASASNQSATKSINGAAHRSVQGVVNGSANYSAKDLANQSGNACPLQVDRHQIDQHTDGAYAVLTFHATCAVPVTALVIDYRLLFDLDPQHKGLLKLRQGGDEAQTSTAIFSTQQPLQTITLASDTGWAARAIQFIDYAKTGVWHIWIGFDHILFLLSLLLPAVLLYSRQQWQAAENMRAVWIDVLKVVTAFTIAHSITLSLATLQILALPSRWVESVIALSVLVAAINNLKPLVHGRRWVAAFGFGLIHGFGFANVLADLDLPSTSLLLALGGFNLGVELGQLAIVAVFLPLAFWLRASWLYRRVLFSGGSVAIAGLACVWLVERAWDVKFDVPGLGWLI